MSVNHRGLNGIGSRRNSGHQDIQFDDAVKIPIEKAVSNKVQLKITP
jgi:hypothetical protein